MPSEPPSSGEQPDEPGPSEAADDATKPVLTVDDAAPSAVPQWRRRASAMWVYARWPAYGVGALFVLLFLVGGWLWATTDLPATATVARSAVVVDRNGDELALLAQDGLRLEVALADVAPSVTDALLAAEDRRFYEHGGIDLAGIARAGWNNVTDNDVEGGSTLTQQLVKNLYLDDDRTIGRKVREAVLAVKLERDSSKDEILERYLNTVYFGRGSYGIEAAARTYFDIGAGELDPARAALLVGILRSPEALDPAEAPEEAKARRDIVLDAMVETGALDAGQAEAEAAKPIETEPKAAPTTLSAGVAPHFVERIRQQVVERFGERALYDRGLIVHTTLDIADQRAAEAAVASNLDDPSDPQAAVVGIDRTGAIRAWVGGRNYEELKLDLVSDAAGTGRQPGSTFKPIVLATNFEAGFGAGQEFDAPAELTLDIPPEPWTVQNAGGQDYGRLTLFEGTVNSVNTVYAQALAQVGPEAVADMARRLGVGRELDAQPSIALGTEEVSPLELATVFSTFSRSGTRVEPFGIDKIETSEGDVIFEVGEPDSEEVVAPAIADTVSAVLSEVPRRGTARRAALDRPMAAKTGTTQRNADAWLAGYTPEYTAVVWMGYADGNQAMEAVDGVRVQGGTIPAQIWHDFMVEALADVEPTPFPEPDETLLTDTTKELGLRVSPPSIEPGERVVVDGSGYEVCVNGWQAVIVGPTSAGSAAAALRLESEVDDGSTESDRAAELDFPAEAAPGTYQVGAACDFGTGLGQYGPTATMQVVLDEPATTTSSSSTSTSTTSSSSTTTTSSTTSTTSTSTTTSSTTTTTAPKRSTTTTTRSADSNTANTTTTTSG